MKYKSLILIIVSCGKHLGFYFFQMYREDVYLRRMFKFKGPELSQLVFSFAKKAIQADNLYSYIDEEIVQQGLEHFCGKNTS